jgi:hypothetical protein
MMTFPSWSAAVTRLQLDPKSGRGAVAATSEVARLFHPDFAFFQSGQLKE